MGALFEFLVDKVGPKTFVDPIAKLDPMLNLVEFFTRHDV